MLSARLATLRGPLASRYASRVSGSPPNGARVRPAGHLLAMKGVASDIESPLEGPALWDRVCEVYDRAGKVGASFSIETTPRTMPDAGVDFVVRVATALKSKPKGDTEPAGTGRDTPKKEFKNPFLPYEEDLWVAHLSPSHTLLLNKFNVVDHHTLVVTRDFQSQEDPLNARDLEAALRAILSYPSGALAFYNCGPFSGRSQPHKHLQVVPLPMNPSGSTTGEPPLRSLLERGAPPAGEGSAPFSARTVPFAHMASLHSIRPGDDLSVAAAALEGTCRQLQEGCGKLARAAGVERLSYNVLLTRDFVMYVPRGAEAFQGVSVNSLGFAGTLLVRAEEELSFLEEIGCMTVLERVGLPWQGEA